MVTSLSARTGITNFHAGSVARLLLEAVNRELDAAYASLEVNMLQSFVSTANGQYLDYLGQLVGCPRLLSESDSAYRYRITRQSLSMAKANQTAVRLACLTVDGVKDLVCDEIVPPASRVLAVQAAIDNNKAFGIYAKALRPDVADVSITYRLTTLNGAQISQESVSAAIRTLLDASPMGVRLDLANLIRIPYNIGTSVLDSRVTSLMIKGEDHAGRATVQLAAHERARLTAVTILY
jgi:hypothetical protein